jgi:hypothetical protein
MPTGAFRLPPLETDEATMVRPDKMPVTPAMVVPEPLPPPLPQVAVEPPAAAVPPEPLPPPVPVAEPLSSRRQVTSAVSGVELPPEVVTPAPALSPAGNTTSAKLVIERGRSAGKQFPVHGEEAYIGRWDADGGIFPDIDLDADDPEAKVSRRHARIVRQSGQYYVEDLGSTNGTFINRGRRCLPGDRHALNDGDELIIGKMFMRFYVVRN